MSLASIAAMIRRHLSAKEALARLVEGNRRFTQNVRSVDALVSPLRRHTLVEEQFPHAIVLSCSDSRVPAEIVFDQGLGDLFVIRVAGNVVAPSLVGSVELAATLFGVELVVVMGHTRCGAVSATVDIVQGKGRAPSANIGEIVERIRPAVEEVSRPGMTRQELIDQSIRANVRASARQLRSVSPILENRMEEGRLSVVGAVYSLESGDVTFFEDGA